MARFDPEATVIEAARQGDHRAVMQVLEEAEGFVRGLVARYGDATAERDDQVQTARIALWRAIMHFDPAQGTFPAYAWTCVRNALRQASRVDRAWRALQVPMDSVTLLVIEEMAAAHGGLPAPVQAAVDQDVKDAIGKLSRRDRQILLLRMEGQMELEIARRVGCSQSTVSRRLAALRARFARQVGP